MKAGEHTAQTTANEHEAHAAGASAAAAPPLLPPPPLHPSAHSPSLTAMQQLLSIASEASKQQHKQQHETQAEGDAAASAAVDESAESAHSSNSNKRAHTTPQTRKRAQNSNVAEDEPSMEEESSELPPSSSSAAADQDRDSASDARLSRMRRSYRQQVLAHQQEIIKVDNITGALREVSKLAKEAQREVAAHTKARSKRGAAASAASDSNDAAASNSNLQQEFAPPSSSSAATTTMASDTPASKTEPASAAGAESPNASPQPFWTRTQQRAVLQKIESLSNKALAEADAQLHAVSGRQLRTRKPKEGEKKEEAASEADDEAAEEEDEDEEEEEPAADDDDDEEEIPSDEEPSDFEEELYGRRAAPARKQADTKSRASTAPLRPVAKKPPPKSAKPSRTLVNSDIDQRPVYIHYVYTRQQYTLSIDEARALTPAKRAEKVVLPVRWVCTAKRSRKNGPGAAPTMADLFVVAKDIATLIHKRRGSIAKAIALFNPRTEKGRVRVYGCRSPGKPGTQLLTVLSMLGVQKLMASSKYKHAKRVRQWTMDWAKALLKAIPIKESKAQAPADTPPAIKHLAGLVFKDKITPTEVEVLSQSAFDKLRLTFGGKPILPETVVEEGAEGAMEEEPEDDDQIADEELQQGEEEAVDAAMADEGAAQEPELDLNDMFPDGSDDNGMVDNAELPWMQLQRSGQEDEPVAAAAAAAPSSSKRARSSPLPQPAPASPPAAVSRKVKSVKSKSKTSASSSSAAAAAALVADTAGASDRADAELVQSLMDRTSNDRRNEKRRERAKQKREAQAATSSAAAAAAQSPSPPVPKKRKQTPAVAPAASRASRSPSPPLAKVSSRSLAAPPLPKRVKRESLGTSQAASPARPVLNVRSLSHLCTPESTPRLTPLTVTASSTSTYATQSFASHGQHTPMFGSGSGSTPHSRDITPLSSRQNSPMPLFSGMHPPVKRHLRMSSNPPGMVDLAALEVTAGTASGTGSDISPKGTAAGSSMVPQMPHPSMAMTAPQMSYHQAMYGQFHNAFMQSGFAQPQQHQMMFQPSMNFMPAILSPEGAAQQHANAMFSPAHGKSVTLPTPAHSLMMPSQSRGGAFTFGSSLSPRGTSVNPTPLMQQQSSGTQHVSHLRGGMVSSAVPLYALPGFPSAQARQAQHALNQQLAAHLKDAQSAHAMPMVTQAIALEHSPVMATAATLPNVVAAAAAPSSSTHSGADVPAPMMTAQQ